MPLDTQTLPSAAPLPGLPEWTGFCEAARQSDRYALELHCLKAAGLQVDLSGQRHSPELQEAGAALLAARHFDTARQQLLSGGIVNRTEHRAAWHSALRAPAPTAEVAKERERACRDQLGLPWQSRKSPGDKPEPRESRCLPRLCRMRRTEALRRMVRETRVSVDNLIMPLFVLTAVCFSLGLRRLCAWIRRHRTWICAALVVTSPLAECRKWAPVCISMKQPVP